MTDWLEKRYDILSQKFKGSTFRFDDVASALAEELHDSEDQINVILSELRKKGLIKAKLDERDARKRIYTIVDRMDALSSVISSGAKTITRADLESLLKGAADLIRTRVDYSFILVLLFYKRISDKWEMEFDNAYQEALSDGLTEDEAKQEARNSIYHDFDIPSEFLWEQIRKDPARLPENFSKAMKVLADRNPDLKDVFENVDFVQFTSSRENAEILRQLVELFSAKPLYHVSPDILGDAYEWILRYFAPQKAKEGEVYTAREVIRLLIELLDPKSGSSIYDPACGSAGMLIAAYEHVKQKEGKDAADKIFLFGQEANHKTLSLAKMNLYIHDIRNAQLALGDTLLYPKFKEGETIRKFDFVIANPPWNQDGYDEVVLKKGEFWKSRFSFGFASKQSADWAWVQHMLASAKEDSGKVALVIDNGCLFRGGKEKATRAAIVNADLIECVILLPEKLFYNTGAPGAILILNKNKCKNSKGKILFINASNEFEQHPEVRKLSRLGDEHIRKIVRAFAGLADQDGFSKIVEIERIKENDFSLNVSLYAFPEVVAEEIDIVQVWGELRRMEEELSGVETRIDALLKELR